MGRTDHAKRHPVEIGRQAPSRLVPTTSGSNSAFEWIPHTPEAKAVEILDVDGGEILDALADQGESQAIVVGPPAREVPRGEPRPVPGLQASEVAVISRWVNR